MSRIHKAATEIPKRALALGVTLALTLPGGAAASENLNNSAHSVAAKLGSRVIRLYKEVKQGKREGFVNSGFDARFDQSIAVTVNSRKSRVLGSSGARSFQANMHVGHDGKMHGHNVDQLFMTVGGAKDRKIFQSPFALGIANTWIVGAGSNGREFGGDYLNADASQQTVASASTVLDKDHRTPLTSRRLKAANLQMKAIIDAAIDGAPTDILPAPFHGSTHDMQR